MPTKEIPTLAKGFRVMMAGNMSDATGLEDVVEVMKRTAHNPNIVWVFVGGGNRVERLKQRVKEENLERCCAIVGRYPFDYMASFYREADVMFISLKQTNLPHLEATIPARLQSYMSAGKPIVGMIGSGVSQFIKTIDCGICVPSGDIEGCASMILGLAENRPNLERWGNNARNYYINHFTKSQSISNLEEIIAD
jgi:glycosyltransferase involved in cell wall biosynthesis